MPNRTKSLAALRNQQSRIDPIEEGAFSPDVTFARAHGQAHARARVADPGHAAPGSSDMDDQQLMDEELGAEIYATGGGIADCENSDQEWGWLVARETAEGIPAQ